MEKFFRETPCGKYDARFYRGDLHPSLRRRLLLRLLFHFQELCQRIAIQPILMHGALLGWHWNRCMLPWDHDIDLCLLFSDVERLDSIAPLKIRHQRDTFLLEVNPAIHLPSANIIPSDNREPNKIDARFIHMQSGTFLDITGLREEDGGRLLATKCPHVWMRDDVLPASPSTLNGIPIFVPHHTEKVLSREYGPSSITYPIYGDWRFNPKLRRWQLHSPSIQLGHVRLSPPVK